MTIASSDEKHPDRFPVFSLLVCILAVLIALALFYAPIRAKLDRFEYWTADWRTLLLADRTASQHPGIVLVVFDPATFDGGVVSPIPRDTHAQILRTIDAMGPKAIGLDFYFVASQGADKDGAMLAALHEIKTPIVLGAIDAHTTEFNEHQRAYQEKFLADAGRPAGYLALKYDPGHIVRRTSPPLPQSPFKESFSRQVALAAGAPLHGPGTSSSSMRIAWLVGPNRDTEPFLKVSAKDLLPGADEARRADLAQRIKGNIVLTGIDMPNSDRHDTALSVWTDDKMLGAMIHAHILAQLLDGRYFTELAGRERTAWLASVGLISLVLGWSLRGRRAAFLNFSVATAILVAIDAACYSGLRIVLPFALTLTVWLIGVMLGQHLRVLAWWATSRPRDAAPKAA
jgi:adenylate cyclase